MFAWCFLPLIALTKTTLVSRAQVARPKSPTIALWLVWIALGALIASSLDWYQNPSWAQGVTREQKVYGFALVSCRTVISTIFFFAILWGAIGRLRWIPLFLLMAISLNAATEFGFLALVNVLRSEPAPSNVYVPGLGDHFLTSTVKLTSFCGVLLLARLSGVPCVRGEASID